MIAVLQAGGRGTRIAELTRDEIPKPLLPIDGVPIIERQIDCLAREGVRDFIVITGHLGGMIEDYLGNGDRTGVNLRYFRESAPLGSGGALTMMADMLGDEDFFFINGDLVFDFCAERMMAFHRDKCADVTLFAHPNAHPHDSDLLLLDTECRVCEISFKNTERGGWYPNLVNAGISLINPRVLRGLPRNEKLNFEHEMIYPMLRAGVAVYGYRSPEYVRDVGTLERIAQAGRDIQSGLVAAKNLRHRQKAIFLDRDGTINKSAGLVYREEQFELIDGVAEAIRRINASGYLALCVTNQSVVARGLCTEDGVRKIHYKMETLLGNDGAYLDDIAFCPHHPDKGYPEERPEYKIRCDCRKPGTGMLTRLANQYNIDLVPSWIVGDAESDIQCGVNAGLRTCLVGGNQGGIVVPNIVRDNLLYVCDELPLQDIFVVPVEVHNGVDN